MSHRPKTSGSRKRKLQIEARQRKICTVAFIDIVQSTALIENLDPEEALDRLGPAVELIMDTCEEFGASARFVGDGALAVFGFPTADENHCARAVEAGLSVIERVSDMKKDRVEIRVGIHSGPVLFGNLSHASFDELTLTGPVVHLADKIQSAARTNTVTVSQSVVDTVGEMFHSRAVGDTLIGGIDHPLKLYEITHRDQAISRWKSRIARGLSPFAGREADLKKLNQIWASCAAGTGSAVAIVGEAGIGKSRLVHEFLTTLDFAKVRVLEISATALDRQAAYAPVTRAINQCFGLSPADDPADMANEVAVCLEGDSLLFQRHLNALQSVLHSASNDPTWTSLGPKIQQDAIVEALLLVIVGMAANRALVVVVEDTHWADQYSLALCSELISRASDGKLMLILTSRTMDGLPHGVGQNAQHLPLGPLDDGSSRDLISDLLREYGREADLGGFVEEICGQTPLFIEEVIRNLKAGGMPTGGTIGESFKVPDSVQPLIAERIDILSPANRKTLEVASVIGTEFPVDLLKKLLRREGLENTKSLASLADLDLLENVSEPTAKFRHALIQQVAYSTLPKRRLRHLHGLFADIIKSTNRVTDLSTASSLAHHAEQSQRWAEASEAYINCGHLALDRAAFDDGIRHFDRSIFCAEKLSTDLQEIDTLNMQARQGLRIAYVPKADFSQILEITGEVERLARKIGDDASALGAGIDRVIMMTILADVAAVIPIGQEKLDAAIASGAPGFIATAAFALSQAYWFTGQFEKATELSEKYAYLYVPENDRLTTGTVGTVSVLGTGTHANALSYLGRLDRAAEACQRMGQLSDGTGKPYDAAFHAISIGILALQKGDFENSQKSLIYAKETSEGAKIDVLCAFLSAPLAKAHAALGQFDAAKGALVMGRDIAEPMGMVAFLAQQLAAELEIFGATNAPSCNQKIKDRLTEMCSKNGYGELLGQLEKRRKTEVR